MPTPIRSSERNRSSASCCVSPIAKNVRAVGGPGFTVCFKTTNLGHSLYGAGLSPTTYCVQNKRKLSFDTDSSARPENRFERKGLSAPEITLVAATSRCALCGELRKRFTTER